MISTNLNLEHTKLFSTENNGDLNPQINGGAVTKYYFLIQSELA